jgi:4-diphosphocytidyl-2-C-methyl-D-erythritol kinase
MRVLAPAKINLHLRVGPPRDRGGGGFHPLLSWMTTAGLFDTLTFVRQGHGLPAEDHARLTSPEEADAPNPPAIRPIFALSCSDPTLPVTPEGNLVTRVAMALADTRGPSLGSRVGEGSTARATHAVREPEQVSAFLNKRIPQGAGLAGGSSDAVATLKALNRLWKLDWSNDELARFGERFGSDLSFFFAETGSAICTGRGEIVRPMAPPAICRWAVLVLPKFGSSTPAVYRRFDEMNLGDERHLVDEPDFGAWSKLPAAELMPQLANDLEAPAFALTPALGAVWATVGRHLARPFRMSGSGSSLFSLCDSAEEAESLAGRVKEELKVDALGVRIAPTMTWETREDQAFGVEG